MNPRPPTVRDYLTVSLLQLAYAFHWGAILGIVIQERVAHFVPPEEKGRALSFSMFGGGLISTVVHLSTGVISDRTRSRWGRRLPYILTGIVLTVPFLYFLGIASNYREVVFAFWGIQFFLNVSMGPYQALIPDLILPTHHGRASGFLGMANIIGQTGGLVLPGLILGSYPKLMTHYPLQTRVLILTFSLAGLLLIFGFITALIFPRRAFDNGEVTTATGWREVFNLRIKEYPDFYWLLMSRFVLNLGFYTATAFLFYYVQDTLRMGPRAEQVVAMLMLIATLASLGGVIPSGYMSDKVSKKTLIYISCGITGVGALIFVMTSSVPAALSASVLFGIGWGAFSAVDWAFACNLLPQNQSAKFMGIWSIAYTAPQMMAPVLVGRLADYFNVAFGRGSGWRLAISFVIFYLVIGVSLVHFIREKPVSIPDKVASLSPKTEPSAPQSAGSSEV